MSETEKMRDEENERPELSVNEQTQTPFSRQAGNNQPLPDFTSEESGGGGGEIDDD